MFYILPESRGRERAKYEKKQSINQQMDDESVCLFLLIYMGDMMYPGGSTLAAVANRLTRLLKYCQTDHRDFR